MSKIRPIAFYLPQFHPIPENDRWWGRGFTDWTNVRRATPVFEGHEQPRLPADLGFYDLRVSEAREAQANLAREYGLYGFCYFHYWFHGKRLLGQPFEEVLCSGKPNFPFCLCWANENWIRRQWNGEDYEILIKQTYSEEDDRAHIRWLADAFQDPRYIRIEGKPLFLIYRAELLPNPLKTVSIWREELRKLGVGEVFLCRVESFKQIGEPEKIGFDAATEFPPHWIVGHEKTLGLSTKGGGQPYTIYDYSETVERVLESPRPFYRRFTCVMPSFDNSPRRKNRVVIFEGSTPERYGEWLEGAIERSEATDKGEKTVFINAWNEWGEGNYLEPDRKWGRAYLEVTKRTVEKYAPEVVMEISKRGK